MQKYEYNGIVVTAASKEEAVMKIKASAKGKTDKQEKFEAEIGEQLVKLGFKKSGKNTYKKGDISLNISAKDNGGEYLVYLKVNGKNGLVGTFDDAAEVAELLASTKWKYVESKPRTANGSGKKEAKACGKSCGKDEKKGKKARACKGSRKATASSLAEYYGIPGLHVRNHGSWSDSELIYKGMCFSEAEVGDSMWELFNSDVEEGYFDKEGMDEYDAFDKFCKEHTDNIMEYVEGSCNSQLEDKMTLSLELSAVGSDHGEEIESAFRKAGLSVYAEHYEDDGTEYISGIEVSGELKKVLEALHGIDDQYIHQFNEKFEGGFGGLQKDYGYRKSDVYGYEYLYGNQATAGVKDLPRKATAGMRPTLLDRTVSHGTARAQDVMPRVLEVLKEIDPNKHKEFLQENPELKKALGKDGAEYWNTEDCMLTYDELFDLMDSFSPQGYYFGAHPGDASDIGYWNCGGECEAGAKKLPRKAHASTDLVSDELYEAHGAEYLSQDGTDEPVGMDLFDEFMMGKTPLEIVQRTFNGYDDYRGDGEGREPFNPNHDYFYVNGYGNVVSLPADSLVAYLKRVIDEDDFAEWLRGEGYLEGTPDLM